MNEESYSTTPNVMVPLNSRPQGTIAPVAMEQLRSYQARAREWQTWPDGRCRRCMECDENIYFTHDANGNGYNYTDDEINALTVAHIRQCHDKDGSNGGRRSD